MQRFAMDLLEDACFRRCWMLYQYRDFPIFFELLRGRFLVSHLVLTQKTAVV